MEEVLTEAHVAEVARLATLHAGQPRPGEPPPPAPGQVVPLAVNVSIACSGVLLLPGDLIVADDDGAVVVPATLVPALRRAARAHAEWEDFARMRLAEGEDLRTYYPLSDAGRTEHEAWRAARDR
jgi:regulator of RNase E activity RraA